MDGEFSTDDAAKKLAAQNEARRRKRKSRGRGLRRTTGCLTCKRRHVRCDEATPNCANCVKSRHTCDWGASACRTVPQPRNPSSSCVSDTHNENDGDGDDNTNQNSSNLEPWDSTSTPLGLEKEPYLEPGLISPTVSVSITANATSHSHSRIQYDPGIDSQPAPTPPDAAFYRWFGLLADDAAATAAAADEDITQLIQSQTLFNGLPLETFRERYSIPNAIVPCLSDLPPSDSTDRSSWHGSQPTKLTTVELTLFENFVKNVSLWIDLYDPDRCFSVFVPHLAMSDAGLMNAILALSSRQLSIQADASEAESDRRVGLQYYYNTLRYLQQSMSVDAYTVSLELLATALIVSMYEMLDDCGNGWERHLKGVFWIQRSQLIEGETGGLRSAVWWAWLRQDVWAAFRERRKTLSFWKPTKAYTVMSAHEKAARIVWIFAKAVDFCSEEEVTAGEENMKQRIERANAIFEMLSEWDQNLPVEFTPLPGVSDGSTSDTFAPIWIHPPAFGVSLQLYHAARILILLNKPSFGGIKDYVEQHRQMETSSSRICRIAKTLTEPASSLMSSQCLYIAGLAMQDSKHRDTVVRLIDDCHRRVGWPRQSLSGDLRVAWSKLDAG